MSGVVFEIKDSSAQRDLDGAPMYFCCEKCAGYFAENRERVLNLRGAAGRK